MTLCEVYQQKHMCTSEPKKVDTQLIILKFCAFFRGHSKVVLVYDSLEPLHPFWHVYIMFFWLVFLLSYWERLGTLLSHGAKPYLPLP